MQNGGSSGGRRFLPSPHADAKRFSLNAMAWLALALALAHQDNRRLAPSLSHKVRTSRALSSR